MWHDYSFYGLSIAALIIIPMWRLFQRAGLNPLWSLLVFLNWPWPGLGIGIAILNLAWSDWPAAEPGSFRRNA